jgi:hypothetical protein
MGTPQNSPSNLTVLPSNPGPAKRAMGELAITPAIEQAVTEIKLAAQLALMMPRDIGAATAELLALCEDPIFADAAIWEKKQGRKKDETTGQWVDNYIEGFSIRFVEDAVRVYRHIRSTSTVVLDTESDGARPGERTIAVSVWDCQANASYSDQVHVRKVVERSDARGREVISERLNSNNKIVFLVHATDDEIQNVQAAKVSKAIRTMVLRLLPSAMKRVCYDRCNATLRTEAERNLPKKRTEMVAAFAAIKVTRAMLENFLGHSVDATTVDELMDLSNACRAIREGETTWKDWTNPPIVVDGEGNEAPNPEDKSTNRKRLEPETARTTRTMRPAAEQSAGKPGAVTNSGPVTGATVAATDGEQLGLDAGGPNLAIEIDDLLTNLSGGERDNSARIERAAREDCGLPATGDLTRAQLVTLRDALKKVAASVG